MCTLKPTEDPCRGPAFERPQIALFLSKLTLGLPRGLADSALGNLQGGVGEPGDLKGAGETWGLSPLSCPSGGQSNYQKEPASIDEEQQNTYSRRGRETVGSVDPSPCECSLSRSTSRAWYEGQPTLRRTRDGQFSRSSVGLEDRKVRQR